MKSLNTLSLTGKSRQEINEISGKNQSILPLNVGQLCNPYKLLPNCRKFEIELGKQDELFEIFGIFERQKAIGSYIMDKDAKYEYSKVKKRMPPKLTIYPHGNKAINRFIEHTVKRLNELAYKGDGKTFFIYAEEILSRSDAHLVMAINHVFPQWQRKENLDTIMRITRNVKKMMKNPPTEIKYKRVYIPKNEDELRPLGVPTGEFRVYLHMWQQIFTIWSHYHLDSSQHGFRPNRGTLTAWKDLLSKVDDYRNIFEFDLRKCFDNIRLDKLRKILVRQGVPEKLASWVYQLSMSSPEFDYFAQDESRYLERGRDVVIRGETVDISKAKSFRAGKIKQIGYTINDRGKEEPETMNNAWWANFRNSFKISKMLKYWALKKYKKSWTYIDSRGKNRIPGWLRSGPRRLIKDDPFFTGKPRRCWVLQIPISHETKNYTFLKDRPRVNTRGSAQGSGMSPILTSIVLNEAFFGMSKRAEELVLYADDGLMLSNRYRSKEEFVKLTNRSHLGVNINEKKSGMVKQDGKWLKEFKFLGMIYDPFDQTIRASTRNGSRLKLTENWNELIIAYDKRSGVYHPKDNKTWELWIASKLMGFLQARMYSGSWALEDLIQDFTMWYKEGSWSSKYTRLEDVEMDIFNSSSFASSWLYGQLSRNKEEFRRRTWKTWYNKQRKDWKRSEISEEIWQNSLNNFIQDGRFNRKPKG